MKLFGLLFISFFLFAETQAQQNVGKGLNFNDETYAKMSRKATLTRSMYGTSLPAQASLKKWAPTPKSQGQYGTCTAWSSTYCAMTVVQSIKNSWTDKSFITSNAYSPGFVYSQIHFVDDLNCSMGAYIDEALNTLKMKGAPKYTDFMESCVTNVPNEIFNKASSSRIKDFAKIFGNDPNNIKIQAVKKSLSENKPVVIGMKCPDSFSNTIGVWNPTENPNDNFGGHAMCVIGYDDNQYGGAFEIQNSWGTNWGNQGYIWIRYQDFANFTKYAYELIDDLNPAVGQDIQLAGLFKLQVDDGTTMPVQFNGTFYKVQKPYRSGTKFRIFISNNEPAFVYSFGTDMTQETYQIFPHKPNISPALTYKQNDVALPDEDSYIEMDNTLGTDHLCVLYSKNPLNIDDIRNRVEKESGTVVEKIRKVLGTQLVEGNEIKYTDDKMQFNSKSPAKSVAMILVEIEHIK